MILDEIKSKLHEKVENPNFDIISIPSWKFINYASSFIKKLEDTNRLDEFVNIFQSKGAEGAYNWCKQYGHFSCICKVAIDLLNIHFNSNKKFELLNLSKINIKNDKKI